MPFAQRKGRGYAFDLCLTGFNDIRYPHDLTMLGYQVLPAEFFRGYAGIDTRHTFKIKQFSAGGNCA
jgi:hypothetical protein